VDDDGVLQSLLNYDPLAEAEKITGKSYKDDEETTAIGFALLQTRSKMRDAALTERGDTVFHNALDRYRGIVEDAGFECVYVEPFTGRRNGSEETYFIYWHSDGLLLAFDTYRTDIVNGAQVHYNWKRNKGSDYYANASSRGVCDDWDDPDADVVLLQSLDAREALLFNLEQLRANGEFVTPWIGEPMLWYLHHHGDPENVGRYGDPGYSQARDDAQANRIARLPEHIRKAIGAVNAGG
jgi:hypothetical protein